MGFTEFRSGERSIGFCLDKAQLSGRPVQIQDWPGLQEVLVEECGPPPRGDFSECRERGFSFFSFYCWWEFFSHDRVETARCICAEIPTA